MNSQVMDARIEAARNGETKLLPGPAGVPEVQLFLDKTQGRSDVAAAEAVGQAGSEGKRDPAGDETERDASGETLFSLV